MLTASHRGHPPGSQEVRDTRAVSQGGRVGLPAWEPNSASSPPRGRGLPLPTNSG